VLSFVDITERHRAEEEMRRHPAMSQSVLNAMEANVAVLNGTGEIVRVNRCWREFARRNGRGEPTRTGVGANCFRICATTTGPEAVDARA
jgi:PAS domain-containing protein